MNYYNLEVTEKNNFAFLSVNRESKLNSLNVETLTEIDQALVTIFKNKNYRGLIITGKGDKSFVAGADINMISALKPDNAEAAAKFGQDVFFKIENAPIPVVAAVNGFALGGGCELALACHIRVAGENAKFGQPEVNLGIIPGYGGTQRLTKILGSAKAIELMLSAEIINAETAKNIGLVSYVVKSEELLPFTENLLQKITSKSKITTERVLTAVQSSLYEGIKGYEIEAKLFAECTQFEDFREGTNAFLEKRKAEFKDC